MGRTCALVHAAAAFPSGRHATAPSAATEYAATVLFGQGRAAEWAGASRLQLSAVFSSSGRLGAHDSVLVHSLEKHIQGVTSC